MKPKITEAMPARRHRFLATIFTGLAIALVVIGGTWLIVKNREPKTLPIEKALWVCDWDITKTYGPGTQEQESVMEQFRALGLSDMKFTAPILYRMGGSTSRDLREGILMDPFDPKHPEDARVLAAKSGRSTKSPQ